METRARNLTVPRQKRLLLSVLQRPLLLGYILAFQLDRYDTVSRSEKFAIQRGQKIHHQNSLKLYINVVRHDLGIIKKKELMQNCDFFDS